VYFTGTTAIGTLVVPAAGKPFLLAPLMEHERAKRESKVDVLLIPKGKRASTIIKSRLPKSRVFGVDESTLTVGVKKELMKKLPGKYLDIGEFCEALRSIKAPAEIELIKKACAVDTRIKRELLSGFCAGNEMELAGWIENRMRELGGSPAFETIVAAGRNSSMPHHPATKGGLTGFCVLDFGVKRANYNSDSTRTVFFGKPNAKQIEIYSLVHSCLEEMIGIIKPGLEVSELDALGRKLLKPYQKNILHSFGHGIGVKVHEAPHISPKTVKPKTQNPKLQAGMVLCIEPGLYFPEEFGIRIEDQVLVTRNGCEVLTKAPRHLVCFRKI
jgi:Xaa-Pro aminopeptidase